MFTVALTGGLASGKSTVARYFSDLGVAVLDADKIAHKKMCDPDVIQKIIKYFGSSILTADQQIHRPSLRDIVFSNTDARNFLEKLLHPLIYKEIQTSLQTLKAAYCILVIPLLFEERTAALRKDKSSTGLVIELNRIMLVTASRELQIQRAEERDHLEKKQIEEILSAQKSSNDSLNKADDIIYNLTNLIDLKKFITRFHRMYLSLAHSKNITLEQSNFLRYYLAVNKNDS